MEKSGNQLTQQIYEVLQKLIGFHRQLLDTVRAEREALIQADTKSIQEAVYAKEALIEAIHQQEAERIKVTTLLAASWKRKLQDLTLPNIIIGVQGYDQKFAEQLRSSYNALTLLIKRISDQNKDNQAFVQKSIEHVESMKKNILGEAIPNNNTYSAQGQKVTGGKTGARFVSKEV